MKRIISISALLPLLASCEKELDFHYHDVEPQLVIEGAVTADGTTVTLTSTTPMDEPMNTTRLTDATVTLSDLTAGTSEVLLPDTEGRFTDHTPGAEGHEYQIEIIRDGKTYRATSTMRPAVELLGLEFQWIKMPYDYVAVLQVSFTDPPSADDCYWVRVYRNGEAYCWSVLDDIHSADGIINEVILTSRKDTGEEDDNKILLDGDIVTASVTPVSRTMFDYLMALQADSNGVPMFSGDFCLGYFLAAPVSQASITFRPDEIPEYK